MNATIITGDSRRMDALADASIGLVVTSPPYWQIRDYSAVEQIGYGQDLHAYLADLHRVWTGCFRVLAPGRRLCINIGDQFARASVYGRYRIIPLHAECIAQCETLGFDFMGSIIWQKKTTVNTTGGAPIMGSYPFPPNGMIELDYEHILVFKKPGDGARVPVEIKERSRLTRDEWKEYFSGHWRFAGERQKNHRAMFPEELPKRLIRMFSFYGDTVLDPFLGSGTTARVALALGRNAVGYEINDAYLPLIREKISREELARDLFAFDASGAPDEHTVEFVRAVQAGSGESDRDEREENARGVTTGTLSPPSFQSAPSPIAPYIPFIKNADARPVRDEKRVTHMHGQGAQPAKVVAVDGIDMLIMESGERVRFLGITPFPGRETEFRHYLERAIVKKKIIVKRDRESCLPGERCEAGYVYLSNKIFINRYLLESGLARIDESVAHGMIERYKKYAARRTTLEDSNGIT